VEDNGGRSARDGVSLEEPGFESLVTLVRHFQNLCELRFSAEAI
jgi:hypothetical protein